MTTLEIALYVTSCVWITIIITALFTLHRNLASKQYFN
jgi:hypothetical protein